MTKKLFTQIRNEWKSNLWLLAELLVVSVVLWYVIDNLYCKYAIHSEPLGFDIEHCYKIELSKTEEDETAPKHDEEENNDAEEILERLRRMPETDAICFSDWTAPYDLQQSFSYINYDTLSENIRTYRVSPEYVHVFRIEGTRGETPEEMAQILKRGDIILSGNVFEDKGLDISTLIHKDGFYLYGDKNYTVNLGAVAKTVRYHDYVQGRYSKSILFRKRICPIHFI